MLLSIFYLIFILLDLQYLLFISLLFFNFILCEYLLLLVKNLILILMYFFNAFFHSCNSWIMR